MFEITNKNVTDFIKNSWRALLYGGLIGLSLGTLYALSKSNEYKAQITVMPEFQNKASSLSGLNSLAGLAGIDVGSLSGNIDAIRPDLYPNVSQSTPFGLQMLNQPVYSKLFKKQQPLQEFLISQQLETWRGKLGSLLNSGSSETEDTNVSEIYHGQVELSKEEEDLIAGLKSRITVTHDKKSGMLTIETQMPDPIVASSIAQSTLNYLTDYVTTYRTEKARKQVDFLTKQVARAKQRYQESEMILSNYRDRNRSLYTNTAKIEEQRIQADFMLAQNLYNDLVKQLELARIRIQEDTPVFKILEPARIPRKKSAPNRTMTVIGFMAVGVVVVLGIQGSSIFLSSKRRTEQSIKEGKNVHS